MNYGYAFEREVANSLQMLINNGMEMLYFKLVDTHMFDFSLFCNHCNQKVEHDLILPKALADFIVITKGKVTFIECKSSKSKTSFSFDRIQDHQLRYALQLTYYDIPYYFIINDRRKRGDYKCYALTPIELATLMAESERKSIKWEELDRKALKIERSNGGVWELGELIVEGY